MNRINKKVLAHLKKQNLEYAGEPLDVIINILENNKPYCFESFLILELLLNDSELTEEEKGEFYYRLLVNNTSVLIDPTHHLQTNEFYDLIARYGIKHYILSNSSSGKVVLGEREQNVLRKCLQEYQEILKEKIAFYQIFIMEFGKKGHQENVKYAMDYLKIPIGMQQSILSYYNRIYQKKEKIEERKQETKEIPKKEQEPVISKKELKKQLNNYYDESKTFNPFDFKNYDDFIRILKLLNYPEEHVKEIMSVLVRDHMENNYYFFYILAKFCEKYPDSPLNEEIRFSIQNMMIPASQEDYAFYKEYIFEVFKQMEPELVDSFEYDIKRVFRK